MTRSIAIAGSFCLVLWGLLSWLTRGIAGLPGDLANGFHFGLDNNAMPTGVYLLFHGALCLILALVLLKLHRSERTGGLSLAIGFAVAFRLVLLPSVAIHESDFYRYLWDGKLAGHGINPFLFEPGALKMRENGITEPFEDPNVAGVIWKGRAFSDEEIAILERIAVIRDANPELLSRVSHPAVPTIYPPVAQAVFFVSSVLFGDSLLGLKLVILAFDLGVIALVVALLRRLRRNPLWVLAYAWNPLVLKEFANSAHYDAVPVFFTVLAVWLAVAGRPKLATALALAGGALAKYFSLILLPVLVPPHPRNAGFWMLAGGAFVAGFVPFMFWDGAGLSRLFEGLGVYQERWHYNGGVFAVAYALLRELAAAKVACAVLFGGGLGFLLIRFRRQTDPNSMARKAAVVMAGLFVFSPTAFPWYFAWVLPFLCLFPSMAWLGLSFLLPLNYLDFHSDFAIVHARFAGLPALWWLIWGGFFLLVLLQSWPIGRSPEIFRSLLGTPARIPGRRRQGFRRDTTTR